MIVEYTVHMCFWSRVKVLLGYGVRISIEADNLRRSSVFVPGEENNLKTLMSINLTLPEKEG